MYGIGGTAYVYFVYGMYNQFNVVTNVEGVPHAILVRALEPFEGTRLMRRRRRGRSEYELTSGPGRLCLAMGIDRGLDKADLLGRRVWIEEGVSNLTATDRPRSAHGHRLCGEVGDQALAILDQR